MRAVAELAQRRRRVVFVIWIVTLLIAAPLAASQARHLTGGGFVDPHSDSAAVAGRLGEFRGDGGPELALVIAPAERGAAIPPAALPAAARLVAETEGAALDRRTLLTARAASRHGAPAVILGVRVPGSENEATDVARRLRDSLGMTSSTPGSLAGGSAGVYVVGQGALWAALQAETEGDVKTAEVRAFPVIAIVLLTVFGSLVATLLPLALGAVAILVSAALIFLLSLTMETSVIVSTVTSMLGLGVAIDYSMFVLVRYREEIKRGASLPEALNEALATSGVAVAFSGAAVIASLAGLFVIDAPALRSIAAGAILVIVIALLATATLLPALISVLGDRLSEPGRLGKAFARRRRPDRRFWPRWSAAVMRRPLLAAVAATGLMLTLALPALAMNVGNAGLRQIGSGDPFRVGVETAAEVAGPGSLGPVQIVVSGQGGAPGTRAVAAVRSAAAADPAVLRVAAPRRAADGERVLLTTTLRIDPTSEAARAAVKRLRADLPASATGASVAIGGATATSIDFDRLVGSSLWKIALLVCCLSFVVLVPLLRSVVLPLKAALLTMLSIAAAYGIVVAIFQWGWLDFLGLEKGPYIDTVTPPLIMVIAFGLSMDYEVFMLSRIRERYVATGDTRRAVGEGLATTGRTITSAALIMTLVFLAFVSAGLPTVQRLGIGLAAAVALDATVVRLVLVPAAMALLEDWNWWMPGWLARRLSDTPAPHPAPILAAEEEVRQ
ncbi:MAG TPA: MMPL family transporter [Solirubrobacterales bacterium]|nr:MMPL family transporter [Solirubrobacterales bacterium]